jgi:hypothetical protein
MASAFPIVSALPGAAFSARTAARAAAWSALSAATSSFRLIPGEVPQRLDALAVFDQVAFGLRNASSSTSLSQALFVVIR